MSSAFFGWGAVARLGLVQACLGAVVVLTTSTLNRVMVVELALPALLPGVLVALHYLVQITRPRMGHGGDRGGRRTPWILGGLGVLALGGLLAAVATAWMATQRESGIALAVLAFVLIGLGVSASGTSLLALLAQRVRPERRAGAATVVWLMMILGFALTAGLVGRALDPYSPERLVAVSAIVSVLAWLIAAVSLHGVEGPGRAPAASSAAGGVPFRQALRELWAEDDARRFAVFVFISMLAYSAQDLILEPFAGSVLGYSPGASTALSGLQHGGVLTGMLLATLAGRHWRQVSFGSLDAWIVGGCLASAVAMAGLAAVALGLWPGLFRFTVFALGVANGAFSIAAIGNMMRLAGRGDGASAGVRMGLWGAAQALAFAGGGLVGAGASDLARALLGSPTLAYALVFGLEALMFLVAAVLAVRSLPAPAWRPAVLSPSSPGVRDERSQPV